VKDGELKKKKKKERKEKKEKKRKKRQYLNMNYIQSFATFHSSKKKKILTMIDVKIKKTFSSKEEIRNQNY